MHYIELTIKFTLFQTPRNDSFILGVSEQSDDFIGPNAKILAQCFSNVLCSGPLSTLKKCCRNQKAIASSKFYLNSMDSGDWQAIVHGVAKSWTCLSI